MFYVGKFTAFYYIMPIPGAPPAGIAGSGSLIWVMPASVVSSIAATAKRMFFFISINVLGLDDKCMFKWEWLKIPFINNK